MMWGDVICNIFSRLGSISCSHLDEVARKYNDWYMFAEEIEKLVEKSQYRIRLVNSFGASLDQSPPSSVRRLHVSPWLERREELKPRGANAGWT